MTAPRYDVIITRADPPALLDLRGAELPIAAVLSGCGLPAATGRNRRVDARGITVARIGPTRWLVRAPREGEAELAAALAAVIDPLPDADLALVSDQFSAFTLDGDGAHDVLAQGTALDLAPAAFPADMMTMTDLFGAGVVLERTATGFALLVERSFADWLERWLRTAAGLPSGTLPANRVTEDRRRSSQ